jgi:hypothetical protein
MSSLKRQANLLVTRLNASLRLCAGSVEMMSTLSREAASCTARLRRERREESLGEDKRRGEDETAPLRTPAQTRAPAAARGLAHATLAAHKDPPERGV